MWCCPNMLVRYPDILRVSCLILQAAWTPSNTTVDQSFCLSNSLNRYKGQSKRNLLFLQVGHERTDQQKKHSNCATVRTSVDEPANDAHCLSILSRHQRTSLRTKLDVLDFLEHFSTQILSANLPDHKLHTHLFWAPNRPIKNLTPFLEVGLGPTNFSELMFATQYFKTWGQVFSNQGRMMQKEKCEILVCKGYKNFILCFI